MKPNPPARTTATTLWGGNGFLFGPWWSRRSLPPSRTKRLSVDTSGLVPSTSSSLAWFVLAVEPIMTPAMRLVTPQMRPAAKWVYPVYREYT